MSRIARLLRAAWRLLAAVILLLGGALCVAVVFPRLAYARRARLKQAWSRCLLWALGVKLRHDLAAGAATAWSGLAVANHISFLDIFVINAVLPLGFVAKREVADWPLIGWLTARTDNLFIARGHRRAAHATQARMTAALAAGRTLAVFPEGTTTRGERVLPFHAALLESAIAAEAPVLCLALAYEDADGMPTTAPAYVGADSLAACLWRIVVSDATIARLTLAGRLASAGADRRHLARHAHWRIAMTLAAAPPRVSAGGAPGAIKA